METKVLSDKPVYDGDQNGWIATGSGPEEQRLVNYTVDGTEATQNYLMYSDLAIVIPVRKNDKNGEFEFGLTEQDSPALIHTEGNNMTPSGYNGIMLEGINVAIPKKHLEIEEISELISKKLPKIDILGIKELDITRPSVLESFSDQCAEFYTAGIKGDGNDKMHWFPMSSLRDFLELQRLGGKDNLHSSMTTLYALEMLYEKYRDSIKEQTRFELDRELPKLIPLKTSQKQKGYRFGINERYYINTADYNPEEIEEIVKATQSITQEDINIQGDADGIYIVLPKENGEQLKVYVQVGAYAQSNMKFQQSNAGNAMMVTSDKKRFLSPQVRSPFLKSGNPIRFSVSGGMLEPGETDIKARALKELKEEQGANVNNAKTLTGLQASTPYCTEMAICLVGEYDPNLDSNALSLDTQGEHIGTKKPISHDKIKEGEGISLGTKYFDAVQHRLEKESRTTQQEEKEI